jgi:hypothetical protein
MKSIELKIFPEAGKIYFRYFQINFLSIPEG